MSDQDPAPLDDRPLLLRGTKVGLAMMRREDIPAISRWHEDLEFTASIGTPGEVHTLEMRQEFFDKNARPRSDNIEFAVMLLTDNRLIGFGGLSDMGRALTASLFVGIGKPDFRNKGYGAEATRLICEYGFFFRNLHSIKVEVNGYNQPALHVYQRLGFKSAGRLRDAIVLNGRRYDQILMDLLRDEFVPQYVAQFASLQNSHGPKRDAQAP